MKSYLILLLVLCTYLLMAQREVIKDTLGINLKTQISAKQRAELKTIQQQLDTASNRVSLGAIHNSIAETYLKASYYLSQPKYDSVIYHAKRALLLTEDDTASIAVYVYLQALGWLGFGYDNLGSRTKALDNFSKILVVTENNKNAAKFYKHRQLATTKTAVIYAEQGNFELAIKQYQSLLNYVKKNKIDERKISAIVYMKLAGFYREVDSLNIASAYANKAIEVARVNGFLFRVAMANFELAYIEMKSTAYLEMKPTAYNKIESYLSTTFEILKGSEYTSLLSKYYSIKASLAEQYNDIDQYVLYAEKAFELLAKRENSSEYVEVCKILSQAYKQSGNFEKALAVYEEAVAIEKKLTNKEEIKRSTLIEIQRRDDEIVFRQKQKELEKVKSQIKTAIIVITLLLLIIALIASFFTFKDRKKKMKLAELTEEKNEHLKEIDLAKSRFFTNISHELRTPLTLIISPLQHLLDIKDKSFTPQLKNTLQLMRKNTVRLKNLVNEILDLAKLESGKLELNEKATEMNAFLERITTNLDTLNSEKMDILYTQNIDLPSPMWLLIDTDKIEQIVTNLISNSFKHTEAGNEIILSANTKNNQMLIEVKDTGKGISSKDLPYVFDRFYQGEKNNVAQQKGTGIGLAYSKELALLMNGDLTAESELGKGSIFTLQFPLKSIAQEKHILQHEPQESNGQLEIINEFSALEKTYAVLIVEDEIDMRKFINQLLEKEFLVYEAKNGKEALEVLSKKTIDLIISDVMMPEMDGYELLGKLKENDLYRGIPVIMLTALNKEADKLQALTIGVDDYLTKPFSPKELIARVQNLLVNSSYRKSWVEENEATEKDSNEADTINPQNIVSKAETEWIDIVKEKLIEELENEDFKLSQLAQELHFSARQFQRRIKKITGLSPKQFQQEIALQKARELLEDNHYANPTAIAYSVGMYNVTRFSKQFESRFGKKPLAYFE